MKRIYKVLVLASSMLLICALPAVARVRVILWFDTEDYLLPADDDACKRLAQLLTERKIKATFKVVGEKARVLETRGRRDVIAALKKHDIAYHANLHSVHPTPTEYLADCGLADGTDEFVRREGGGAEDVRRIFGVKTLGCYGQPGSSWAPQAIAALKRIHVSPHGVPCYVDEGDHVGLNDKPFWYMGTLNVYRLGKNCTRMELHEPEAVSPAKEKVLKIVDRLRGEGGGLVSIYYHPCEWVHRQFWDGVNFSRGANPPRESWKLPPQRTAQETDAAFSRFASYIDYIRALPGVSFVTASDLPLLYPDFATKKPITESELTELAEPIAEGKPDALNFRLIGQKAYSLADQFEALAYAVTALSTQNHGTITVHVNGILGPEMRAPGKGGQAPVEWSAFRAATRDVANYLEVRRSVPSQVFIGSEAVSPEQFLSVLARVWCEYKRTGRLPEGKALEFGPAPELVPVRYIAEDTPGLFGGWIIHKENFRAPKLMELARLQGWTLKPAIPAR